MTFAADFLKSKTTLATALTIVTTIAGALQGRIDPFHAAILCLGVIHLPFLRDSWVKSAEKVLTALEGVSAAADGGEVKP